MDAHNPWADYVYSDLESVGDPTIDDQVDKEVGSGSHANEDVGPMPTALDSDVGPGLVDLDSLLSAMQELEALELGTGHYSDLHGSGYTVPVFPEPCADIGSGLLDFSLGSELPFGSDEPLPFASDAPFDVTFPMIGMPESSTLPSNFFHAAVHGAEQVSACNTAKQPSPTDYFVAGHEQVTRSANDDQTPVQRSRYVEHTTLALTSWLLTISPGPSLTSVTAECVNASSPAAFLLAPLYSAPRTILSATIRRASTERKLDVTPLLTNLRARCHGAGAVDGDL